MMCDSLIKYNFPGEDIVDKLLFKCMTKATNKEKGNPRRSSNWITSKRALFKIYDEYIECGNWHFNVQEITNPVLYKMKQSFIKFDMIQFEYNNEAYQFGFNPWAHPAEFIKLDFTVEHKRLKYSPFSLVVRLFLIGIIIYYFLA